MIDSTSRRLRGRLPVVAVALAAVLLGACGGSGDDDAGDGVASLDDTTEASTEASTDGTEPTETTAPVDTEEALLEFAACMREHGVDMPDPQIDENGGVNIQVGGEEGAEGEGPPEGIEEATEACQDLMPTGPITRDGEEFDPTEMQDEVLAFTQCMRNQGIDMPDPDFGEDGRLEPGPETDTADDGDGDQPAGRVLRGPFGTLDLSDPETEAAFEICSEEAGMFGPDGGPTMAGGAASEEDDG